MPELKAGLPGNFSSKKENANLWLLMMKAYVAINPTLYEEKNKILAFLNKMDTGCGKSFAEGWLMKCADKNVKDKDQTFTKIEANFIVKFIPPNHTSKAWHALAHMKMKGDPFNSDFHKFKAEFELKAAQSGVTYEHILMDMLGKAVLPIWPSKWQLYSKNQRITKHGSTRLVNSMLQLFLAYDNATGLPFWAKSW